MPQHVIEKIRDAIRKGNYDMTMHAYEEMAEDNLSIIDVESAVLSGMVIEKQKGDPRGTKYVIHGNSYDESTTLGVVGRFKETGVFLIITVYAIVLEGVN
ncbi:MAG: DUF4258 domain-containing protein [Candidatus Aminicenantes bacterium]|nr:DUF4258 domain-containing protein [Candidatus Aminicenantes bacterium]